MATREDIMAEAEAMAEQNDGNGGRGNGNRYARSTPESRWQNLVNVAEIVFRAPAWASEIASLNRLRMQAIRDWNHTPVAGSWDSVTDTCVELVMGINALNFYDVDNPMKARNVTVFGVIPDLSGEVQLRGTGSNVFSPYKLSQDLTPNKGKLQLPLETVQRMAEGGWESEGQTLAALRTRDPVRLENQSFDPDPEHLPAHNAAVTEAAEAALSLMGDLPGLQRDAQGSLNGVIISVVKMSYPKVRRATSVRGVTRPADGIDVLQGFLDEIVFYRKAEIKGSTVSYCVAGSLSFPQTDPFRMIRSQRREPTVEII